MKLVYSVNIFLYCRILLIVLSILNSADDNLDSANPARVFYF